MLASLPLWCKYGGGVRPHVSLPVHKENAQSHEWPSSSRTKSMVESPLLTTGILAHTLCTLDTPSTTGCEEMNLFESLVKKKTSHNSHIAKWFYHNHFQHKLIIHRKWSEWATRKVSDGPLITCSFSSSVFTLESTKRYFSNLCWQWQQKKIRSCMLLEFPFQRKFYQIST